MLISYSTVSDLFIALKTEFSEAVFLSKIYLVTLIYVISSVTDFDAIQIKKDSSVSTITSLEQIAQVITKKKNKSIHLLSTD